MIWKDKDLKTLGDVADVVGAITEADDKEAADEFMRLAREEGEHADENIGYLTGYFDPEIAAKMRKLFGVRHPVFAFGTPTAEEAFEAGLKLSEGVSKGEN